MKRFLRQLLFFPCGLLAVLIGLVIPRRHKQLIWGPTPIISNQYWAEALRQAGWDSQALLSTVPGVTRAQSEATYFHELPPKWLRFPSLRRFLGPCFAWLYIVRNASVIHLSFLGGPFGQTWLWRLEAYLLRWTGIKTIVMPFGGDAYLYSKVADTTLRHGLLLSFPLGARQEAQIERRVRYWSHHANVVLTWFMVDGMSRWDAPVFSMIVLDTGEWQAKTSYSSNDGRNGPVRVIHTPNFRGFKGTEFIQQAVAELQAEGLQVELMLLEKVPNSEVRRLMPQMDILAEQLLAGYALSGMEGMASGLPVLSNIDFEAYTRPFRRFGFLNECPILSTAPETIKLHLRVLVTNPALREQLGRAGRQYVEKYHSYAAAQYLFGSIYDKLLHNKDVDLMNLFHPLKSEYNRRTPVVEHPLHENRLPARYLQQSDPGAGKGSI
jgi:hypothetical protein